MSSSRMNASHHRRPRGPFDDAETSDIILRTSDRVDFHAHRIVLILASPFFRDMFSLPQPTSSGIQKSIIDVTETSMVLESLLRLCYPVDDPDLADLALVGDTLEAALKYQLTEAIKILKRLLRSFIPGNSLYVFGISCRLLLEEEASLAARRWKELCPNVDSQIVSKGKLVDWKSTIAGNEESFCFPHKAEPIEEDVNPLDPAKNNFQFPDSDLTVVSSDGIEFRVHQLALQLASPILVESISTCEQGHRSLSLPENSHTVSKLLGLCYPATGFAEDSDALLASRLLLAVKKYEMGWAIKTIKALLNAKLDTEPLNVFFAFIKNGFVDDATGVVRNALLQQPLVNLYSTEMECTSARLYYQLLEYRHQCHSAIVEVCSKYESLESTAMETEWWTIATTNIVPMHESRFLATPIAQRQLLILQNEAVRYFDFYCENGRKQTLFFSPDKERREVGKYSLKDLHRDSRQLEEEVNSSLSAIKLRETSTSVYKTSPAEFFRKN